MQNEDVHKNFEKSMLNNHGSTSMFSSNDFCPSYTNNSTYNQSFENLLKENNLSYTKEFPLGGYRYDFKVGNILIEINPTITHNITVSPFGEPKKKDYHYEKTTTARSNGYRCINVWEWDDPNKVLFLLMPRERIYARKCIVKEISVSECREFLDTYHIQGYCKDTIRIGLYFNNDLYRILSR